MSRFGPDPHAFFQSVYTGVVPWDIGEPQPSMRTLIARVPPRGPALDVGCGSGDLAIYLAQLGHSVVGVDFVEAAIDRADARRASLAPDVAARVTFRVADAARPSTLGVRFASVFDSGFLHLLDPRESDAYVADLALALESGGRYYLHAFAVEFPIPNAPRAVTGDEVRARFREDAGWRMLHVGPAEFLSAVAAPVPAIAACIERL